MLLVPSEDSIKDEELSSLCKTKVAPAGGSSSSSGGGSSGGLGEKEFWDLTTKDKLSYFTRLCSLSAKKTALTSLCKDFSGELADTCFHLLDKGMSDTQRLEFLAERPDIRDTFYGAVCDNDCVKLQIEVVWLQLELVSKMESLAAKPSRSNNRQIQGLLQQQTTVKDDPKAFGMSKKQLGGLKKGLEVLVAAIRDFDNLDEDPKKIALVINSMMHELEPILGRFGTVASALAGPIGMVLTWGQRKVGDVMLNHFTSFVEVKLENGYRKARDIIERVLTQETNAIQSSYGHRMYEETLNDVSLQIAERTHSLIAKIYLSQDDQAFYDVLDELKGLRFRFELMKVFIGENLNSHTQDDLSTLMNQVSTFEGEKQLGTTRSWMSRFCSKWENTFLCLDMLLVYISVASVRDQMFANLAAVIKNSDHCDADNLAKQVYEATKYR